MKANRRKHRSVIEQMEIRRLLSASLFGPNLVLNGGAETYDGTADGYNLISPAHWTADGDVTIARYNRYLGEDIGIRKPDNGGNVFFTGGPDDDSDNFFQTVDLSSIAGTIDAGQVNFAVSALLGGDSFSNDNAQVFVNFKNADGVVLAQRGTGSVSAGDRDDITKLIGRAAVGTIPATTRFAQVQIHFKRDDPSGYNFGFADNVSLVIATNTASTVGITPALVSSTLPTTAVSEQRVHGSMVLSLTNTSTSVNKGLDTITLFASTNGTIDSTSIPLVTIHRKLSLGPNRGALTSIPIRSFAVPAGTYTILAQTTDRYLTVDTTARGPMVVVQAPVIALSASVGEVAPTTVSPGRVMSFLLTLQNTGNINSTGLSSISIGLSNDGTTASAPIVTVARRVTLQPNNPRVLLLRVRVPAGQAAGNYKPFVTFRQRANSVTAIGTIPFAVG